MKTSSSTYGFPYVTYNGFFYSTFSACIVFICGNKYYRTALFKLKDIAFKIAHVTNIFLKCLKSSTTCSGTILIANSLADVTTCSLATQLWNIVLCDFNVHLVLVFQWYWYGNHAILIFGEIFPKNIAKSGVTYFSVDPMDY